jgi:hypothetical protein
MERPSLYVGTLGASPVNLIADESSHRVCEKHMYT